MCFICDALAPSDTTPAQETGPSATSNAAVAAALGSALGLTVNESGDAAGNSSTTASIDVGDYFHGAIDVRGDTDWIKVELEAGQQYTIALAGTGALGTSNDDPYLTLRNASGTVLAEDDIDGPGIYASHTFTASYTGTYYIEVAADSSFDTGTYGVSVTEGDKASYSAEMGAGALLRPDASWSSSPGTPATVSWSIHSSATEPFGGNPFIAPSPAQVDAIEMAMAYTDAISGLTLTQVNPGGTSNFATIRFGAYAAFDGSGAYAYFPGNPSTSSVAGDVWLNNTSVSTSNLGIGTYSYFTILHEIGHAIGLHHPGDYNATPGVTFTYQNNAQFAQDSHQYTVMSYFDETNTGASSGLGYPDTFMLLDYKAIHALYGADTSYNGGNTTYGFNATGANTAYDFTSNTTPFLTIYDGSGQDLIDLSGYGMGQFLTLMEGAFSNIGGFTGNMSIAYGAVIENAIGGSGSDTIEGNNSQNVISGGSGADSLLGNGGVDTLRGEAGNDTLRGGTWHDSLDGGTQEDRLFGDSGNDSLYGGAGFDTLYGGEHNDRLEGGNQADNLFGEAGNDRLFGGNGFDRLFGGDGNDLAYGGEGSDALFGEAGNDSLYGQNGDDRFFGGTGNDLLDGGAGNDSLNGGAGFDTLLGSTGNDTLTGAFNADTFVFADFGGGFGQDTITDFDATNDFERIDLSRVSSITSLTDLLDNHAAQVGADVVINAGGGNTITLLNVSLSDLGASDFVF